MAKVDQEPIPAQNNPSYNDANTTELKDMTNGLVTKDAVLPMEIVAKNLEAKQGLDIKDDAPLVEDDPWAVTEAKASQTPWAGKLT